jgi:choice-of-anchor C domain-containing protein
MKFRLFVFSALTLGFCSAAFSANLIDLQYGAGAGSFELPGHNNSQYVTLPGGSAVIMGWTVGGASIDWVKTSVWVSSQGTYSLDMNGTAPVPTDPPQIGSISTNINTTASYTYRVTFDISGYNSYGNTTNPKQMSVSAGLVLQTFSLTSTYNDSTLPLALTWETRSFDFVAQAGTSSAINFQSLITNNTSGMLLDNVRVELVAVPEASSAALGLCAVGLAAFRRRR